MSHDYKKVDSDLPHERSTASTAPLHMQIYHFFLSHPEFGPRGLASCAVTGACLGMVMASAFWLAIFSPLSRQFAIYTVFLTFFHLAEFFMTACFNFHTLTWSSFLLDHSRAYSIAFLASFAEYWIEFLLFPSLKHHSFFVFIGVLICLAGQTFRTGAMLSAGSNFSHQIATEKRETHVLVTSGFYAYVRHPSYFGWFWWSIGLQVLLGNPLCVVAYSYASWKFFAERIPYEEMTLLEFFGAKFEEYRKRVPTGIPMIK